MLVEVRKIPCDADILAPASRVSMPGFGGPGRAVLAVVEGVVTAKILRKQEGTGLACMGRSVRRLENGTQYLRAIAAEGGIPVRLLSEQKGGYRSALVGLVADLSRIGLGCPREVALGFAAQRTRRLPVGYRTREYHALFVDFAFEVLELRELSPDGISAQDVEPFLDRVEPGWRDGLSLRLDGDAARSLLSDAVLISAMPGGRPRAASRRG